jgi:hypothetical protein
MLPERKEMDRRRFLKATGTAGLVAVAAPVLISADGALAVQLTGAISQEQADTLLAATRRLYPHDTIDDVYYLNVVKALDAEADETPATKELIADGLAGLDRAMSVPFVQLSDGYQTKVLREQQDTAFVQKVRGKMVVAFYNQKEVWNELGYEGASYPYGGYLYRGFDDLAWLPEPPAEASPPMKDDNE